MCFSAESSFTSAVLLAGITYASALQIKHKSLYPFLIIPLVFCLMQFVDGFAWLAFQKNFYPSIVLPFAAYFFLFISHFYWLLVGSFIYYCAEKNPTRRKILKLMLVTSSILSLVILALVFLAPYPPAIKIVNHSIQYSFSTFDAYPYLERFLNYVFLPLMIGPPLISSLPGKWLLSIIIGGTFIIAIYFYNYAFVSVWCFFGTIASVAILLLLPKMNACLRNNTSF